MRKSARLFALWLVVAALVVAADQASKFAVLAHFQPGERMPITGFFNLALVYNPGASFSFLANAGGWQRWFFTLLALGISVWIIVMIWRQPEQKRQNVALTLILGGALGNAMDRVAHGAVVDFLDFHVAAHHWPIFNLADCGVTLGAAALVWEAWRLSRSTPPAS
jgi:signal peptidase II